ncbi:MAG: hypothetical protein RLZZ70_753 [Candidatus Parcubacteria bacterium]|jgi:glycosyltransferase involved in cell wall biosynthesis
MTKVTFIQPSLSGIGSIEKIVPIIAKGLVAHGFLIDTVSFYDPEDFCPDWSNNHVTLRERTTTGLLDKCKKIYQRLRFLSKIIKNQRPDIIIVSTHGSTLIVLFLKAIRVITVPVIVYVHQALTASDRGYMVGTKLLYRFADGFACVSQGVAHEVSAMAASKQTQIAIVYNPLPQRHTNTVQNKTVLRAKQQPVLISAARLEKIRGIDTLVDYCCTYFNNYPGELWILGDGSLRSQLEGKVVSMGMSDRIRFFGMVTNVEDYMLQATIYVSLARAEALGVSLIEALSMGLPLISTDVPYGPREVMDISAIPGSYPQVTKYGLLISNLYKHDSGQETKDSYNEFVTAVNMIVENKINFPPTNLIDRSGFFSTDRAVSSMVLLINKLKNSAS